MYDRFSIWQHDNANLLHKTPNVKVLAILLQVIFDRVI